MGLQFDGSITLGNVIEILALGGGWIYTLSSFGNRLKTVEGNQAVHNTKLDSLTKITEMQGRFDERIVTLRRDVDDLKRGKGFIQQEVNGEYGLIGKQS